MLIQSEYAGGQLEAKSATTFTVLRIGTST